MAIKSLTGSRKVIDPINRLGHCASYSTIEELETELTFEVTREKRLTPNGMSLNSANKISVAFDNFDIYVETISGKDTLHDTAGIAYKTSSSATGKSVDFQAADDQEVEISMHVNEESFVVTSDSSQNKKRKREFIATGLDIEPYRKKPKMLFSAMIPRSDVIGSEVSTSLLSAKVSDFLWMAQCSLSNNVPM